MQLVLGEELLRGDGLELPQREAAALHTASQSPRAGEV